MKYETPIIEIIELDHVFTLIESQESMGNNEDSDDVGGWVPGSK